MFYQYNSIFKKTYLSSDPETTLDWSQDFDLSETISGIIFFLATEFDLGLSLKLKNGLSLRFLRLRPLPATGPSSIRRQDPEQPVAQHKFSSSNHHICDVTVRIIDKPGNDIKKDSVLNRPGSIQFRRSSLGALRSHHTNSFAHIIIKLVSF